MSQYIGEKAIVVQQSKLGWTQNVLAQLPGVKNKDAFACAFVRGLGGPLTYDKRAALATEIFGLLRVSPPDNKRIIDSYTNEAGKLMSFKDDVLGEIELDDLYAQPLISTADTQRAMATIKPWLENKNSFILVGPEGCGKQILLANAFKSVEGARVATIHCNAQTSPPDVQEKIAECCTVLNTNSGRVYRPKGAEHLILYLKDANLVKPDKWGTSYLVAFLQQIVAYKGFYDKNKDALFRDLYDLMSTR